MCKGCILTNTIKEILQHIIDTERILSYRALCISRREKLELPGFDENLYVLNSNANQREINAIFNEFKDVRNSTVSLFQCFSNQMLENIGMAGGNKVSVRALGYIICGHLLHHIRVINQLYLQ